MMRNLLKKKSAASVRLPPLADESRAGSGAHSPAGSGSAQEEPAERPGESPAGSPLSPSRRNASFKLRASGAVGSLRGAAAAPAAPAVAIDVLGNLLFLQGKLKELTDMLGGFEGLRLLRNSDAPALVEELRKYLCAEDGTSDIIRRGLALNNASRHRLDVDHPRPEEALLIMQQPALAHLQRFPVENEATIIETWMREPAEFLLASVVLNFLRFLEHESKGSRELHTVVHLVDALVETVRGVLVNRAATMEQEPAMVWGNMMASCRKFWASRPEHSDAKYRAFVVMSWCEERERDVLAIMEDNVEERADNASRTPLWGTLDAANVRLRVCTPMFNFMDFVVDFLDFSYGAGYVFKPSTRPPAEWGVDEVVEWFLNLRMAEHVEAVRQCGVTGEVLLEMTKTDLDVVLGVTDPSQRTKLFMGLESLRVTSRHEMMPKLKRQGRKLVDLVVPDGMKGGGKMVVQDPGGHNVEVHIPRRTADQVEVMRPGMKFQHVFTYSQTVLNKWQLAGNQAMRDAEPGVVPKGQARTGRNLWKGAIRKIKIMNKLESRINKVLRMSATDETVRLAAMDFFPKEAAVLRDFLLVNVSCKRLEISYNNFGPEGCTSVCQALMDNRTVAELRFSSNRIGDRGALEVARLIKTSNALMEVDLGNNLLTDASGVALLQAAATSPPDRDVLGHRIEGSHTLKRLMLYNNRLGPDTFHAWAKSIKRHPVLEVDLSENEAGDQGVAYVAGYIAKYWIHPRLDLRAMGYGPEGARLLSVQLAANNFRVVRKVYLSGNALGLMGARHLALVVDRSIALEELDVSGCELGNEGVRVIAKALQENMTLEYIDLGDNGVSDDGAAHIASMLAVKGKKHAKDPLMVPASLRRVVLSNNPITHEGFSTFAATVTTSCQTHVEASCCHIRDEGLRTLAVHLPANRTLRVLDVSSNLLTADGLWVMADALKENESVETVRVNDNRVGDSGGRAVAAILKYNHHIKEFNISANSIGSAGIVPLCKVLAKRTQGIEVWIEGNPALFHAETRALVEKVERRNRIVTIRF